MTEEAGVDVEAFAAAYVQLAEAVERVVPPTEAPFARLLREHLGRDTADMPVISMAVEVFDQPNLQRAIDAFVTVEPDNDVTLLSTVGIRGQHRMFGGVSLASLTQRQLNLEVGPVDYVELPVDVAETLTCIDFGLLLLEVGGVRVAMLVRGADERMHGSNVSVEVMADRTTAAAVLARLRALMQAHNIFRHKVVSLSPAGNFGSSLAARFVERPGLTRADVVLPEGTLDRIERMTTTFSERAALLRAGGRHLRRGLLLHGAPGTGKTHTVRYLLSELADRTAFILSGQGLAAIGKTVQLARALQPSIVVLEDVDLVAEERTRPHAGTNPVLFELLNQMDGVEEDADIVFVLTTNRADLLEPALAARPGRVDLAVEVPLPAPEQRARLLDLYATGLQVDVPSWEAVVDRTDGVSAAYLRELLRQAALSAAIDHGTTVITETTLLGVLADLAQAHHALTSRLLGATT